MQVLRAIATTGVAFILAAPAAALERDRVSPVQSFAEALALRRTAAAPKGKLAAEYQIARALQNSKLYHAAAGGFAATALSGEEPTVEVASTQIAALEGLNQIREAHPGSMVPIIPSSRLSKLLALTKDPYEKQVVYESAVATLVSQLSDRVASEATLRVLKGGGAYELWATALTGLASGRTESASHALDSLLALPSLPDSLKNNLDSVHVLFARALYSLHKFDLASAQLKLVRKSSNDLAESLSELSWAFLMNERHPEAIGTAMNLQAGGLRHTFAPEAPMVMAMSLNELCQYPESVHAIQMFRKGYEKPHNWLTSWAATREPLYPLAVQFIKKAGTVPERIASEWIRSPLFFSSQEEINLLYEERESAKTLTQAGLALQRKVGADLLKLASELKPKIKIAKMKLKPGEGLPERIHADLERLRDDVILYRRLQRAAPVWRMILARQRAQAPLIQAKLVKRINQNLEQRSLGMLEQLDEIAENVQLIEVEIYNGASEDILWQNHHPDYKGVAEKLGQQERDAHGGGRDKIWDWGRSPAALESDETQEIWEDELGSFKADLYDNCSSKDKYLALKIGHRTAH